MTWENAWREGRTPWDAMQSPPILASLVASGRLASDGAQRALVTGCGSGYDVFTLATAGYRSLGLDMAPTAAEAFRKKRDARGFTPAQADIEIVDFFAFSPGETFDVIWDYTFLCAIEPDMRPQWAKQMQALLSPGGDLYTLLFPVDIDVPDPPAGPGDGPPYGLHPELAKTLLQPAFHLISLEQAEASHPGREGKEWLARWQLV